MQSIDQAAPRVAGMAAALATTPSEATSLNLVVIALVAVLLGALYSFYAKNKSTSKPKSELVEETTPQPGPARPVVRCLFGTQTGTAERFAKLMASELKQRYGEASDVVCLDIERYAHKVELPKEKVVLLCIATYGDGDPTDSSAEFVAWLLSEAEAVENGDKEPPLKDLHFGVFGLGNKQYEHFCAVGKKVFKAMQQLGATPIVRRGDGDDDGVIDEDFEKWREELYDAFAKSDLLRPNADQSAAAALTPQSVPQYDVEMLPAGKGGAEAQPFAAGGGSSAHDVFYARLATVRELHGPKSERSCVHVELDMAGCSTQYVTGDHVAVFAENSPAVVEEVASLLGVPLDARFTLRVPSAKGAADGLPEALPGPLTLRSALARFADVLATPHKEALDALSAFATDPAEAAKLREIAHGDKQLYLDYCAKPHRSLLEVLREFKSAKPSLGAFFACIAPRLQPRFYSISSSNLLHPTTLHVTCSVVRDTMPTGRIHEGVCSTWFKRIAPGARVPVFVRHSHFRLPKQPSVPVIMVGPGTGLAPFRGFLQERQALVKQGTSLGSSHLFFGCRHRQHDYIYEEELAAATAGGALGVLHVAFSRDTGAKDYVQHHIKAHASQLWDLLALGAHVYVCGDAKHMAKDVHRALVDLVAAGKRCSGTQAEAYVKEMQDSGRYQRDVW